MSSEPSTYRPKLPAEDWAAIEGYVHSVIDRVEPLVTYSAKDLYPAVTRLVHFTRSSYAPVEDRVVFDPVHIGRFVNHHLATYNRASRNTIRARLRRVSEALLGDEAAGRFKALGKAEASRPYTPPELAVLDAWAWQQRTLERRTSAGALLALGLGAGLTGAEIIAARGRDLGNAGTSITVRGGRFPRGASDAGLGSAPSGTPRSAQGRRVAVPHAATRQQHQPHHRLRLSRRTSRASPGEAHARNLARTPPRRLHPAQTTAPNRRAAVRRGAGPRAALRRGVNERGASHRSIPGSSHPRVRDIGLGHRSHRYAGRHPYRGGWRSPCPSGPLGLPRRSVTRCAARRLPCRGRLRVLLAPTRTTHRRDAARPRALRCAAPRRAAPSERPGTGWPAVLHKPA